VRLNAADLVFGGQEWSPNEAPLNPARPCG
jgi:hypothetical protein